MLVKKYHDSHCKDKETLVTIRKAVDASPELRSKKELIETFLEGINDVDDVMLEWRSFVAERKEQELETIINEERLKPEETRKFIEASMQAGESRTVGTDIDKLMPPVSRFGGGNRAAKKQNIIERLKAFFEKFFGIGYARELAIRTGIGEAYNKKRELNAKGKILKEAASTFGISLF